MATKRGCTRPTTLVPAQPLDSSPTLGQHCGANENALRGALVMVATVAMAMTMAITAAATATVTREVTLPRRGDEMTMYGGDEVRAYATDNAGASATAEQFACTEAALWDK